MKCIGNGSFAPQRRKENAVVSQLADEGLLLNGNVTPHTISAFAFTRNLSPSILLKMYQQAGLIDREASFLDNDHYPEIYRSRL